MSSPREEEAAASEDQTTFPAADADAELNPSKTDSLQVDYFSSQLTTSKELKEKAEEEERQKKEEEKKDDAAHKVKSTIIISGVIVAVIGAIFAVTKKLRET
ncbi:hypothetical protein BVC80_1707g138 [Macleaya cordata]|uniref:Transmembrane protein n=1 Tax=Macleaya cordata TaxID=56857 RepID=A0A200Q6E4_MACCD|nr:hypothetical protein BVC80_1707g138 [Macleaya cordata]